MSTVALVFMLTSMISVTTLAGWCLWRILRGGVRTSDDS